MMNEDENLKENTAKGFFWAACSNGTQQLVTLLVGIVLARLLDVADYGMVAMLSVFSVLAGCLQESGFTSALAVRKEARHEDFNAVFWFNVSVGVLVYVLLFFTVPFIAEFNHTPELTLLGRVIFVGFVVSSTGTAHSAYLFRNLMVRQRTAAQVIASFVSGLTGIVSALLGWGCWSLVVMDLTYKTVNTVVLWHYSSWRPTWPVDFRPAFEMFAFSSRLLLTNVLNTLNGQLLQTLLGHFYPAGRLGHYSQANKWNMMGTQFLTGIIGNVAQPVLARVNGEADRQVRIFRKMLRFTSLLSFPLLLGLALVAPEFIVLTIGSKWAECVPYLQTLCVGGAFVPLCQAFSNLIISKGRSDYFMTATCGFLLLQLAAVVLLYREGIQALLYAVAGLNVVWTGVWYVFARRLVRLTPLQVLSDTLPFLLAALAGMSVAALTASLVPSRLLSLAVKVVVAAIVYCTVMQLSGAAIWRECVQFVSARLRRAE